MPGEFRGPERGRPWRLRSQLPEKAADGNNGEPAAVQEVRITQNRNPMRTVTTVAAFAALFLVVDQVHAQRPASPRGEAATQIGEAWITVDYGRPILRGRTSIFGSGDSYGDQVVGRAPVWRVGANKSTRINTETDMQFGTGTLAAGEYSVFAELSEDEWTLIFSSHEAKDSGREEGPGIWGAYGYSQDMDVLRVPMHVHQHDVSVDQFTISFQNVTSDGGTLAMMWEHVKVTVDFNVAR